MLAIDASSIIFAWHTYPHKQFPPFWRWVTKQVRAKEFVMCTVALDEVGLVAPDCAGLLRDADIHCLKTPGRVVLELENIKRILGITDYVHGDGVDENDLLIIAAAKVSNVPLVSDEAVQLTMPKKNRLLKIPAVCRLPEVGVECMNWVDLVRRSGAIFE